MAKKGYYFPITEEQARSIPILALGKSLAAAEQIVKNITHNAAGLRKDIDAIKRAGTSTHDGYMASQHRLPNYVHSLQYLDEELPKTIQHAAMVKRVLQERCRQSPASKSKTCARFIK